MEPPRSRNSTVDSPPADRLRRRGPLLVGASGVPSRQSSGCRSRGDRSPDGGGPGRAVQSVRSGEADEAGGQTAGLHLACQDHSVTKRPSDRR